MRERIKEAAVLGAAMGTVAVAYVALAGFFFVTDMADPEWRRLWRRRLIRR